MSAKSGRYGQFGGRFVAEVLWGHFERVQQTFTDAHADAAFREERDRWMARIGHPTPLVFLDRLSAAGGGAQIWVKRDDLLDGQSYCATSAVGQALLAKYGGYRSVFCETATGDFGVALASAARALGLDSTVFIGRADFDAEPHNARILKKLGTHLHVVDTTHRGRGAAWARAMRFWAEHPDCMYAASALAAPSPYPQILDSFNALIGAELRVQLQRKGVEPDFLIAPVGSGAYAAGLFSSYIQDVEISLGGVLSDDGDKPLIKASKGVMYGCKTSVLQDSEGLPLYRESRAGGLSQNALGPQHAAWKERGRVSYEHVSIAAATDASKLILAEAGILISLEAGHALAHALSIAPSLAPQKVIVVGLPGSGIRDLMRPGQVEDH